MLKAGGIWVSPAEVESRLLEHPAVREAAVVGVADEHGTRQAGGRGRRRTASAPRTLIAWCRDGLAHFKAPHHVVFVEELPKTATGKLPAVQGAVSLLAGSPQRLRGSNHVPYVIASACIDVNDKACVDECPVDCIYEGDRKSYINPKECIDCGACEPVCPVEAITQDRRVADERRAVRRGQRARSSTMVLAGSRRAARHARRGAEGGGPRDRHRAGRRLGGGLSRCSTDTCWSTPTCTSPCSGRCKPAWVQWARDFGPDGILDRVWDADGRIDPAALDELFAEQGVDAALLFCEYSPKVTGIQRFEDLLPIVEHNPTRFRPVANVNPHLHFPIADELAPPARPGRGGAQAAPGPRRLPLRRPGAVPGVRRSWPSAASRSIVHCGTSHLPRLDERARRPRAPAAACVRDFPTLDVVLAHGGRGWWYDAAAFMALLYPTVWIELSGLPPKRLPEYYAKYDLDRLARKWIFATDWPGAVTSTNARAVAGLGLDDDVVADVLGRNALRVYAGLDHLAPKL